MTKTGSGCLVSHLSSIGLETSAHGGSILSTIRSDSRRDSSVEAALNFPNLESVAVNSAARECGIDLPQLVNAFCIYPLNCAICRLATFYSYKVDIYIAALCCKKMRAARAVV